MVVEGVVAVFDHRTPIAGQGVVGTADVGVDCLDFGPAGEGGSGGD
jgi:hypothetical protein